ncbi:MAG: WG repeat-containing protein [Flavobacteriaceae bacterium]|nr:WG repeat-containing protein [Flavobacteriaceae bacterium]
MKNIIQIFLVFVSAFCFGQKDTNWYAFYNADSTKIGYKNADGKTMIEPKYHPFLAKNIFKNVIVVVEEDADGNLDAYFLNKSGKIFGIDSVYVSDSEFAQESDGKIRFRDTKTNKAGFFDANGNVVIPAIYSGVKDFHNGIAIVIKDAVRKCWWDDNGFQPEYPDCEHWYWAGGKRVMINAKNEELFEIPEHRNFSYTIDYTNFKVNENPDSEIYTSYKGKDGNIYSFYSPERDFNKWFDTVFFPDFKKNKTVLPKYFYDLIAVSDNETTAWKNYKKEEYLDKNQKNVDEIFKKLEIGKFHKNIGLEDEMSNTLYFAENELPKENLEKNTVIGFYCNTGDDFFTNNTGFEFTKIGDSFYITSAPEF